MLAAQITEVTARTRVTLGLETAPAWKQLIGSAEPFLQSVARSLADQIQEFDPEIAVYARYALTGQGKQLRPVLVAFSAGATGKINDSHVLAAVIIEMVHLATLVHDDVIDEADIRRGRPTLAANWGNEISVLLGDCLFAHALKLAASFPTPEICRSVAAATNTVCSGEIRQTQARKNIELPRAEYFKALSMKTGELFALSCDLGAFLNGAAPEHRTALRQYGMALGTAYQVYDDCLDLFGSEETAGKSLGSDLAKGKMTLPMLWVLERASMSERQKVKAWVQDWDGTFFPQIMALLESHEALKESREEVHQYLQRARKSESRASLNGVVDYLAQQMDALRGSN